MPDHSEVLYIRLPRGTRDLLRLRAMSVGDDMSTFARNIIMKELGKPTPEESIFLASIGTKIDQLDTN